MLGKLQEIRPNVWILPAYQLSSGKTSVSLLLHIIMRIRWCIFILLPYKSCWVWSSFHPHAYVKWRCQCELFRSFFIKEGASTEKECWHIRYLKESEVIIMDTVDVTEVENEEDPFTENITDFESAEDVPPVPVKRSLSHQFDAISQAVATASTDAEKNMLVTRNNTIYGTWFPF